MPQPERTGAARACLLAAAAILLAASSLAAQTIAPTDPEARDVRPSPVLIEGDPVLWITAGAGPYTTQYRAERITQRIMEVVHDRSIRDPTVTVTEVDGSTELRAGSRMLMVVTAADAASLGASRASIALQHAQVIEQAIRSERLRYAPSALLKSGIYGSVATLIFAAIVWIILRVTGALRRRVTGRQSAASTTLGVLHEEVLQDTRMAHATRSIVVVVRVVLILIAFDLYLTFVLGLFPWTRAVSRKLLGYAYAPVGAVAGAFVGYLPEAAVRRRHCRDRLRRDAARRRLLPEHPGRPARVPELPRRVGGSDGQDRSPADGLVRPRRRVPLPAGVGLAGIRRRLGVHRRAGIAGLELGAVEHDRRHRPDLHERLPARRSGQTRRRVRRRHRIVAAGHAGADDQERNRRHPQQHRAGERRDQLHSGGGDTRD